jgi:putative restriction endonuclease
MSEATEDPDLDIRLAAFNQLRNMVQIHASAVPWAALRTGFTARGRRFRFASAAEGIFRPFGMRGVLSLKTVVSKPSGRIWYHDQHAPVPDIADDVFWYAFRGSDPDGARNQWLWDAMSRRLPLIYFYGIAPAVYEPLFPAFVIHWDPNSLSCGLSFSGEADSLAAPAAPDSAERRYTLRLIRQRVHQAIFRAHVLDAYGSRCALSGLAETRLIDAAHIIPDNDQRFGQPDIRNGICMSKIHHAAFDAGLIGIDPDYVSTSLSACSRYAMAGSLSTA